MIKARTWYLSEDCFPEKSYTVPGQPMSQEEIEEAGRVLQKAKEEMNGRLGSYVIDVPTLSGTETTRLRGECIQSLDTRLHVLREIPPVDLRLGNRLLGYRNALIKTLINKDLRSGLVIFSGSVGAGKSTLAACTLVTRLELYGGFAITLEDPPEYPLQGQHGSGHCIQMHLGEDANGMELAIRSALRCYPAQSQQNILMFGEIRSGRGSSAITYRIVESALSGHLVYTTIHADDPINTIQRVIEIMAMESSHEAAYKHLASGLQAVIHLRPTAEGIEQVCLQVDQSVRSKIRQGTLETLSSDLQRQIILMRD